ncbi:MAG: hypothetical protein JXR63_05875 [Spirochaetales bacterium]|nr:hypothetical protein [Spirochaetales bacterium]
MKKIILCVVLGLLLAGCPEKPREVELKKIADLVISKESSSVKLSWSAVAKAQKYKVYRSSDDSGFSEILETGDLTVSDSSMALGIPVRYYVCSVYDSKISESSNIVEVVFSLEDYVISKVDFSNDSDSNTTLLKWDILDFAEGYQVYKKIIKSDGSSSFSKVSETTLNYFSDNNLKEEFVAYKIYWKRNGIVYGEENTKEFYTCILPVNDIYEDNSQYSNIPNTLFIEDDKEVEAVLYYQKIGEAEFEDVDWYKFNLSKNYYLLKISLSSEFPVHGCYVDVYVDINSDGVPENSASERLYLSGKQLFRGMNDEISIYETDFGLNENVDVYLKFYNSQKNVNYFGSYEINIQNYID